METVCGAGIQYVFFQGDSNRFNIERLLGQGWQLHLKLLEIIIRAASGALIQDFLLFLLYLFRLVLNVSYLIIICTTSNFACHTGRLGRSSPLGRLVSDACVPRLAGSGGELAASAGARLTHARPELLREVRSRVDRLPELVGVDGYLALGVIVGVVV